MERKRGTRFGGCLVVRPLGRYYCTGSSEFGVQRPQVGSNGMRMGRPGTLAPAARLQSDFIVPFPSSGALTTVPSPARLPRPHHHIAFCSGSREPPRLSAWHQICPHDHPALVLVCCVGAPRTTIFEAHLKVSCRKAVVTRDVRHGCHIVSVDTTTIDEPLLTVLECEGICLQCEKVHRGIILHTP